MTFKLGKLPARPGAVSLRLASYLDKTLLPTVPKTFGHQSLVVADSLGMLGNDNYGNCVWAGAGHETMLWNAEGSKTVQFTDKAVLSDYSAVTGFTPSDPSSDQGTDMSKAASYRRKTGVLDAAGKRHKVSAYVALDPKDLGQVDIAAYLFGSIGVGIEFPGTAMDQFNAGKPWDVVRGAKLEGGHYCPLVGKLDNGNYLVVTWGAYQEVTPAFLAKYMDEGIAYFSHEMLTKGLSLEGVKTAQLSKDLTAVTKV